MLRHVTGLAISGPKRVIGTALLILVAAAVFGLPVIKTLPAGGTRDPGSESSHAQAIGEDKFGHGGLRMVITVKSDDGVGSADARAAGTGLVTWLRGHPFIGDLESAWTSPPQVASTLVSRDDKTGLVIAGIKGGEVAAQQHAEALADTVPHFAGVTTKLGGEVMGYVQINHQTLKDLLVMELIAIPLSFAALTWVFGGMIAAALPVAVGAFAIAGSMTLLRLLSYATDVSVYGVNLTLAMGLALAVDYTLLIISRYRDELATGKPADQALTTTMVNAGRTVLFSATTVALAMTVLAIFPMYLLRSFAYAGFAVVILAAAAALLITPAAIVLLGRRLNALDVHRLIRRLRHKSEPVALAAPVYRSGWYRWTKFVMRHAVPAAVLVIAFLAVLGTPLLGIKLGYPDERAIGKSFSAHQVNDAMRTDFALDPASEVFVVIPDVGNLSGQQLGGYAADLSRVADVVAVSSPAGTFAHGRPAGPGDPDGLQNGAALFTITSTAPLYSAASETQLDRLHAVPVPHHVAALFTGKAQINRDAATAVTSRLPWMLAVIAVIMFVLLFLLTGSVVLPAKALVLNMLSLSATFGALVWIFQDGHLSGLGTTATGSLISSIPILLFCMTFGLSMDYEVFLIARIQEFWAKSAGSRAANDECVALGLARTGRVVTAAALLMAITFSALLSAQVSIMRMFGLGVALAVLVDATLVRVVLLPAFMRVLGRLNWWAPAPLARLHRRVGISEGAVPAFSG